MYAMRVEGGPAGFKGVIGEFSIWDLAKREDFPQPSIVDLVKWKHSLTFGTDNTVSENEEDFRRWWSK